MASADVYSRHTEEDGFNSNLSSPRIHVNSEPISTDSMVSVNFEDQDDISKDGYDEIDAESIESDATVEPPADMKRQDSFDILNGNAWEHERSQSLQSQLAAVQGDDGDDQSSPGVQEPFPDAPRDEEADTFEDVSEHFQRPRTDSTASSKSQDSATVDWSELEKTENEETRDDVTDESTRFLLARLEQENNALRTDPKFGGGGPIGRLRKQSRPPSIHVLKRLVTEPTIAEEARYSISSPPPMTELEFWAALVKDYPQTASRLPTLTSNKIKAGVPPPLRGVVWMSMVGARDKDLGDQFEKLAQETSPYENLIGKDIGRSFPGVEKFRDADGEGQTMLAKVLKSFSLYDKEIGYCQGLGFLVGPLLMQMDDKDAFCVLVKLMENYDLRSCFLPDLAGLHLRIYQFQRLLDEHLPELAAHLASLQVEAAYLTQWFLSFFAVTCPLPMLFRIYDVIFAEGASETIMRVALSLMRRNETKIMESHEFEEVMHLLLSRSLWETYSCDADDLVNDFMDMTGIVTRDSLKALESSFKSTHGTDPGAWYAFLPDATAAASRFLGRLWANSPNKSAGLSPGGPNAAHSRQGSFLRRTPSKQSIAASLTSNDQSSEGTNSMGTAGTDATAITRDSSGDMGSVTSKTESMVIPVPGQVSKEDRDLHGQIEDLLTAMSDMQKQQAELSAQLQKEREERNEDHVAFEALVKRLPAQQAVQDRTNETSTDEQRRESYAALSGQSVPQDRRQTMPYPITPKKNSSTTSSLRRQTMAQLTPIPQKQPLDPQREFSDALERVNQRMSEHRTVQNKRSSQILETRQRLRESLLRSRDQLQIESSRSANLSQQLDGARKETDQVRECLRDAQARLQSEIREKQRLEQMVYELQGRNSRANSIAWTEYDDEPPTLTRTGTNGNRMSISSLPGSKRRESTGSGPGSPISGGGLREFVLSRSTSLASGVPSARESSPSPSGAKTPNSPVVDKSAEEKSVDSKATDEIPVESQSTVDKTADHTPKASLNPPSSAIPKRGSSLATQSILSKSGHIPATEDEILVELVNAKTAEAVARQELEEVTAKLDAMRRMLGIPTPPSGTGNSLPPLVTGSGNHRPSLSHSTVVGNNPASNGAEKGAGVWNLFSPTNSNTNNAKQNTNNNGNGNNSTGGGGLTGGLFGWGKRSASSSTNNHSGSASTGQAPATSPAK